MSETELHLEIRDKIFEPSDRNRMCDLIFWTESTEHMNEININLHVVSHLAWKVWQNNGFQEEASIVRTALDQTILRYQKL